MYSFKIKSVVLYLKIITCFLLPRPFAKFNNKIDNLRMKWSGKTINTISRAFAKCDAFHVFLIIFRNWHHH